MRPSRSATPGDWSGDRRGMSVKSNDANQSTSVLETGLPESCPECGARIRAGAESCDLCGYAGRPLFDEEPEDPGLLESTGDGEDLSAETSSYPESGDVAVAVEGVFCNQCGWKNPGGSRFCSRCGSALQEVSAPSRATMDVRPQVATLPPDVRATGSRDASGQSGQKDPEASAPKIDFRKRSVVVTVGSILLVLVLYTVTEVSKQRTGGSNVQMQSQTEAEPAIANQADQVPADLVVQANAIRQAADSLSGAAKAARLAELVNLYLMQGFLPQAAAAQADVAAEIGTAQAWADAGNLSYQAMQRAEGALKITYANQAIEAYGKSLEIDPNDLDVRTDMATAHLATNNPMEGVRQIRDVLDRNPDHVQANFNYGVMLSMIGRTDQSIVQFERVMALVEPGTDTYAQAELALRELRRQ